MTYQSDPVAEVCVVRVVVDEVRRDTQDNDGGDSVQSVISSEQWAVESVRADCWCTVVCCWSCGAVRVGATSVSHFNVCSV
jgi:hypothetical protein